MKPAVSALGQKQTCAAQKVMSALPPKADMCSATRDVRFVPIADITAPVAILKSFDHSCNRTERCPLVVPPVNAINWLA